MKRDSNIKALLTHVNNFEKKTTKSEDLLGIVKKKYQMEVLK